jgi:hypothetical protein
VSDLPLAALDYETVVAEYFLSLRGAGLMISPLDQEVVAGWERRGIPVAVVCRGLRRGIDDLAARRPGAPRSIRALRLAVDDEWRAYQAGRVGDSPAPPYEADAAKARLAAARKLLEVAARAAHGPIVDAYRDAWRTLAGTAEHPGTPLERFDAALASADAGILAAWLGALAAQERRALGPRVRKLAGPRPPGASLRAYRGALRAHLLDAGRAAGLTCLRGTV